MNTTFTDTITHTSFNPQHGHVSSLPFSQIMEIDSGNRKPDSDKEPNNMETSIDVIPINHTQESNGEQPAQGAEQTNVRDPNPTPVLEHPEKGDDRATNQEQTGKTPLSRVISKGLFLQTLTLT